MTELRYNIIILTDERKHLSLDQVASHAGLHTSLIERYVDCGLVEPIEWRGAKPLFDVSVIARLRIIERLRSDLSINLAGVAVILEMAERLRALQSENDLLRSRI
jgi:MerR family transcriptional regulator, heat shock protein HspR